METGVFLSTGRQLHREMYPNGLLAVALQCKGLHVTCIYGRRMELFYRSQQRPLVESASWSGICDLCRLKQGKYRGMGIQFLMVAGCSFRRQHHQ